ncbi:BLUF domain protein [Chloroherpeton thalassium ATCC 35110]|uniref:BLUF domain protein n=1 Tax=Chloroherpeton thalassium (strain ATCC 35110 / GB-78) TaxID=517418 RepID=B3QX03_CHLT3|nr:BLUF domain-containing protein [Chloroherpeton thalassium]ACF14813.1 BLUF domain protein [Chloroherpeton thalassium ATCC 35110]
MNLHRVVYYSMAAPGLSMKDVDEILKKSNEKNKRLFLSGGLLYCQGVFIQVLEGGLTELNELLIKLYADVRHQTITILEFVPIQKRQFEGWEMSMVFFNSSRDFQDEYMKYSSTSEFHPRFLNAPQWTELIQDLLIQKRLKSRKV